MESQSFSQLEKSEEVDASITSAEDKPSEQKKPVTKTPETSPPSLLSESSESKKKLAGAVNLFGGIDVLASKQTKSLDDVDSDDSFLSRESPPPIVKKEEKAKKITVSLFDADDDEEDESDWNEPIFSKPMARNTIKVCITPGLKNLNDWFALVYSAINVESCVMFSAACRGATTSKEHGRISGRRAVVLSDAAEGQ